MSLTLLMILDDEHMSQSLDCPFSSFLTKFVLLDYSRDCHVRLVRQSEVVFFKGNFRDFWAWWIAVGTGVNSRIEGGFCITAPAQPHATIRGLQSWGSDTGAILVIETKICTHEMKMMTLTHLINVIISRT